MEMNYRAENRQLTISLAGELDHHAARGAHGVHRPVYRAESARSKPFWIWAA